MAIQNFKVSINGEDKMTDNKLITFEQVVQYVKRMNLEANLTVALIGKARTVPPGALQHFVNNIHTYVANLTRDTHGKNQQT